jgi:CBS domain containing-hemolysin-like protein
MTWTLWFQLALLLALSASFSAAEAAMLSINKVRLRHLMEQGHRGARLTFGLLTQLDHVIGTLLVANNLINVAISAVGTWVCIQLFGSGRGLLIATLVVTSVILLIGEVTPKIFAATHAELVAFAMARPLRVLMTVLYPVATFFTWSSRLLLRLARIPTKRRSPLVTEEEIKVMIQMGREAGVLAEGELRMLHRIFEFSDSTVTDIMVPRAQIAGIDLNAKPSDVLDVLIEEGHSRIPVYRDTLDDIVGVLYARDLLAMVRHGGLFVLADLIRPISVVPSTKRLAELLSEFQRDKTQIAMIQDQQRKTIGLVTIEDLMEEIVGEIREDLSSRRS